MGWSVEENPLPQGGSNETIPPRQLLEGAAALSLCPAQWHTARPGHSAAAVPLRSRQPGILGRAILCRCASLGVSHPPLACGYLNRGQRVENDNKEKPMN